MRNNQKGTSLVSVIVSFAVLMIVMLLLQVSLTASGRYAARAREVWELVAGAEKRYANSEGSKIFTVSLMAVGPGTVPNGEGWGNCVVYKATETNEAGETVEIYYLVPN